MRGSVSLWLAVKRRGIILLSIGCITEGPALRGVKHQGCDAIKSHTGQNIFGASMSYAYTWEAKIGFKDCEVVPDTIWEKVAETFNWDQVV